MTDKELETKIDRILIDGSIFGNDKSYRYGNDYKIHHIIKLITQSNQEREREAVKGFINFAKNKQKEIHKDLQERTVKKGEVIWIDTTLLLDASKLEVIEALAKAYLKGKGTHETK